MKINFSLQISSIYHVNFYANSDVYFTGDNKYFTLNRQNTEIIKIGFFKVKYHLPLVVVLYIHT